MKRVNITGLIIPEHFTNENETTEADVVAQLNNILPGEEAEIVINSPGGEVFTATAIFNHIRKFAKTNPCTTIIQGLAGSAASYIALAAKCGNSANKIKAYDNSIFFIHNVQSVAAGDHNAMIKEANILKSMSDLIFNSAYAKISKDSINDIHKAMDNETFYFGAEIVEHGYADVIEADGENADENADKNAFVALAKNQYTNAINSLEKWHKEAKNSKQITASLQNNFLASLPKITNTTPVTSPATPEKVEDKMDIAELKAKHPEVYNEVLKAGALEERSRVNAHLKMATDSGDVSAAVEFINNGTPVAANEVTAKYHEVFCKTQLANARIADNTPAVTTPVTNQTDAHAEAMAAYKKAMLGGR